MKLRTAIVFALVMPVLVLMTGHAENPPEGPAPMIQDYVTAHYRDLQDDLLKGDGASLTLLLNLLHTANDEQDRTIKRLCALSEAYPDPSEFADRVPDFMHKSQAPAVPAATAVSESDLDTLCAHLKYKARLHLSMVNGDEIDATFSSFDKSRKAIWVKVANSKGGFDRKVYALRNMKNVYLLKEDTP